MKKKEPSFEDGLARLEELVAALEDRGLSLDKALAAFEEGLGLSAVLRKKLEEVSGKVEMLTRDLAGRPAARPFAADNFNEALEDEEDEDGEAD